MSKSYIQITRSLYPLALLYGMGVWVRNFCFNVGFLPSKSYKIPLISVGNITVGGTGKTPHTEYLVKLLNQEFKLGVLSAGYKRKSKGFVLASESSTVAQIGDESVQIKRKFPNIAVAVDKKRSRGIDELKKEVPCLDVILLDDAFQHRYVNPGINILLVDFNRLICDDALLPAGRLREPASQKSRANVVIVTKCPTNITPLDFRILTKRLNLFPYQTLFFSSLVYGNLKPVFSTGGADRSLSDLTSNEQVILLTGIASPQKMRDDLSQFTRNIHPLTFSDHHQFNKKDIALLKHTFDTFQAKKRLIITTEKDAVRLLTYPELDQELKNALYYLPIEVEILQNQTEQFTKKITEYVKKNRRNSLIYKPKGH